MYLLIKVKRFVMHADLRLIVAKSHAVRVIQLIKELYLYKRRILTNG